MSLPLRPPQPGHAPPATAQCEAAFPAEAAAVRAGLARLMASPPLRDLGTEDRGTAELLLAEALNNVVEHAYARWPGDIRVTLSGAADHVGVCIRDQGLPMPGASLPEGRAPEVEAIEDLPEGGFGWFLIRSLAQDLAYHRDGEVNALTFRIPVDNWEDSLRTVSGA